MCQKAPSFECFSRNGFRLRDEQPVLSRVDRCPKLAAVRFGDIDLPARFSDADFDKSAGTDLTLFAQLRHRLQDVLLVGVGPVGEVDDGNGISVSSLGDEILLRGKVHSSGHRKANVPGLRLTGKDDGEPGLAIGVNGRGFFGNIGCR